MVAFTVKPILPRSLFYRALLILLAPIVVLQLVVGLVFFERHYQRVTRQMTENVALELTYAIGVLEAADTPAAGAARLAEIAGPFDLGFSLEPQDGFAPGVRRNPLDLSGVVIARTLADAFAPRPVLTDLTQAGSARIEIPTRAGVLRAEAPRSRLSVANPHQLLVLMIAAAGVLSVIAVLFLRNQVRPIRALAEAAEAFGKGRAVPFRPTGAEEVRRAGAAFLSMRARIERQIEQRTLMLSGVSHDLRTPLTRMKLTLALMPEDEDVEGLRGDVEQMSLMIEEFLAFARGDGLEEPAAADPFALAAGIAEDARRAGAEITLAETNETPANLLVTLRPGAVTRAVQNLVSNAARHGKRVTLQVRLLPKTLDFIVEDDGPGIPEADRARAMAPFERLDSARTQEGTGRVGLGLSIALDVARSHGGALELAESHALGGLRATLRLPR